MHTYFIEVDNIVKGFSEPSLDSSEDVHTSDENKTYLLNISMS